MNTPDKCPQCGAEIMEVGAKGDWTAYLCESYIGVHAKDDFSQSNYCRERAAHAATKRELDAFKSKANRCEDEMNHQAARANNAESDAQSWQQQSDRFSTQLLETFHALEKSEARLRELESLRVSGFKKIPGHVWITVECQTEAVNLAARTLGEAMPRKEGV